MITDNASTITYVHQVKTLIKDQAKDRLCFLPPYSPDLMPAEGVFSQIKSIIKQNDRAMQCSRHAQHLVYMHITCSSFWNDHINFEDCYGHVA